MSLADNARALFRASILHPQWLTLRRDTRLKDAAKYACGHVLDIGCADRRITSLLPPSCRYHGIDYPDTSTRIYRTRPDVYGDARALPHPDSTFDTVLLLEVLEHVPDPELALAECARVLVDGGRLVLSMPFLYPVHDAPFDFQRYTIHALRRHLSHTNFELLETRVWGHPIATAALLTNIALAHTALNGLSDRSISVLLIPFVPIVTPILNLVGWLFNIRHSDCAFMPHGHWILASRTSRDRVRDHSPAPTPDDVKALVP